MLKNINFGYTSAETESDENPDLLGRGFYDLNSVALKAIEGKEFIFLGYKGSGKTAIARHIELSKAQKSDFFITNIQLGDFPFTPFSKIVKGDIEPEAKYPIAWAWLLYIKIIESISQDNAAIHERQSKFDGAVRALSEAGFIGNVDISKIVNASSKRSFSIKIPEIIELSTDSERQEPSQDISFYVSSFKSIVESIKTPSDHLIIIDGLDDIITKRSTQYSALGGLMFEISRINSSLRSKGLAVKICCLCRTDIFERISNPNKNKLRQDYCVELDWYEDPSDISESMLVKAANLRAKVALNEDVNVLKKYFIDNINGIPTGKYLLNHTRHTPRDFFQLLNSVKYIHGSRVDKADSQSISSGIRRYSINYFLPEIKDELDGYLTPEEINSCFQSIEQIGRVQFSYGEIRSVMMDYIKDEKKILVALDMLFSCGAISNVRKINNSYIYTAKYRNRHSSFKEKEMIEAHRGLWKALNLSTGR